MESIDEGDEIHGRAYTSFTGTPCESVRTMARPFDMNAKLINLYIHMRSHYFLASNGIDTEYVTAPIDTNNTFVRIEVEDDTNIKVTMAMRWDKQNL